MICPRCGSPDETKRFCRHCGLELQTTLVADAPIALGEVPRPRLMTPTARHQGEAAGHLIGRTIDQRYYIEARIGSGGMGAVYRARRLLIGDKVLDFGIASLREGAASRLTRTGGVVGTPH